MLMFPVKTEAVPGWFEDYENDVKSYDMAFTSDFSSIEHIREILLIRTLCHPNYHIPDFSFK